VPYGRVITIDDPIAHEGPAQPARLPPFAPQARLCVATLEER